MPRPGPFVATVLASLALGATAETTAQTPGWHRIGGPTGRGTCQLEFDTARQRLVLMQGTEHGELFRTYERIHGTWSLRAPAHSPSPRQAFAAGYDPLRHRIVLFGGTENFFISRAPGGRLDDTWEYDGFDWQRRQPTVSPTPQHGGYLLFDSATNQMLLCGGNTSPQSDTWHYDGTTWTWRAWTPFSSEDCTVASDPIRREIIAIGPATVGPNGTNRMFRWRGSSWQRIAPPTEPPPFSGRAMAWHPGRSTIVLHGGARGWFDPTTYGTELWEWDGTRWARIPAAAAIPRRDHDIAFDPTTGSLVVAGGNAFLPPAVTADWDGTSWHNEVHTLRWGPDLATYDHARNRVFAVRQVNFNQQQIDAVEWDGSAWHPTPLPQYLLEAQAVAFDETRDCLVLMGRDTDYQPVMVERDAAGWSAAKSLPPLPPGRNRGPMAWHGGLARVVSLLSTGELEAWDGSNWLPVPGSSGGPQRPTALIWDSARDELLAPHEAQSGAYVVSVWTSNGWTTRVPANSPQPLLSVSPLGYPALGYDENRKRMVLFGGELFGRGRQQWDHFRYSGATWEWTGDNWELRKTRRQPAPRENAHLVFDRARQQLLLLGGLQREYHGGAITLADVWALDSEPAATLQTFGTSCGTATMQPRLVAAAPEPDATAFTLDLEATAGNTPSLFLLGQRAGPVGLGHGCSSWLPNPAQVELTMTNANGFASIVARIPRRLSGYAFVAQAAAIDPNAPAGFVMTNALAISVGY